MYHVGIMLLVFDTLKSAKKKKSQSISSLFFFKNLLYLPWIHLLKNIDKLPRRGLGTLPEYGNRVEDCIWSNQTKVLTFRELARNGGGNRCRDSGRGPDNTGDTQASRDNIRWWWC